MSVLNGHRSQPSLVAKLLGLSSNGDKVVADDASYTTPDGAAVVDLKKLVQDPDFQKSAEDVRAFLDKNVPQHPPK